MQPERTSSASWSLLRAAVAAGALLSSVLAAEAAAGESGPDLRIELKLVAEARRSTGVTARLTLASPAKDRALHIDLTPRTASLSVEEGGREDRVWRGPAALGPGPHQLHLKVRPGSVTVCLDSLRLVERRFALGGRPKLSFRPSRSIRPAGGAKVQPVGRIVFEDGFARADEEIRLWRAASGTFAISASLNPNSSQSAFQYWGSAEGRGVALASGSYWFWDDYRVDVSAKAPALPAGWGVVFYYEDEANCHFLRWTQGSGGPGRMELVRRRSGVETVLASCERRMRPDQWNRVAVVVSGSRATAFLNGLGVLEATDDGLVGGRVGLLVEKTESVYFDDVSVRSVAAEAAVRGPALADPFGPAEKHWSDLARKRFATDSVMRHWAHPRSVWLPAGGTPTRCRLRQILFHDASFRWEAGQSGVSHLPGGPVEVELFAEGGRPGTGYRFVVAKDAARITRRGRELASGPLDVEKLRSLECRSSPEGLALRVNGGPVLSATDPEPLVAGEVVADVGPVSGWKLKEADWRDGASVVSSHRLDYGFDSAPTAWEVQSGRWRAATRWACVPEWSFFGGRGGASSTGADPDCAVLWNRRRFRGDFDFEVFFAPMEASAQQMHFGWPLALNLVFAGDGRRLDSGYALVYGLSDLPTRLFRKGREVAVYRGFHNPGLRRDGWGFYHSVTRTWQHLRVLRRGSTVEIQAAEMDRRGRYLGLKRIISHDDPQPPDGDRIGLWTWGPNGMAVARATISYAESPGVAAPPAAAPGRAADREVSVGPAAGPAPGGAESITNLNSGGHFERQIVAGPVDLERIGTVEFDMRTGAAHSLSLFACVRGQFGQVILAGPRRFRPTAIPLGVGLPPGESGAEARWRRVSFDLLRAFRRAFPEGPLVAESVVIASPFQSIEEIAGLGVNPAGSSYDIAGVRMKPSPGPPAPPAPPAPGPPPAPRVLVDGHAPMDDFEGGLGGWEKFGGWDGASLYRDPERPASGRCSLRLVNDLFGGTAGAWITRDAYDPNRFPVISFDYRFPPSAELNLLVRRGGRWYEIRATGTDSTWPVIGRFGGFVADGKWHRARVDLRALLRPRGRDAAQRVQALVLADSKRMANRQGMVYWIDNFCRVPAVSTNGETAFDFEWVPGEKVSAFSHVIDDEPGTVPPAKATGTGGRLVLKGSPGGSFLHVRVRNSAGRWSGAAHLPIVGGDVPVASAPEATPGVEIRPGPPPAPYVSYIPSERLCRTDFEWDRSPEWPERQMGEFRIRRQAWVVRDVNAATGGGSALIVNLDPRDFYSAYFRTTPYDPVRWPRVSFDYRFRQGGCAMNLSLIVNRASAIVEWTGSNAKGNYFAPFVIGRAEKAVQDNRWHNVDFDLRGALHSSLFKDPAKRPAITVSDIACWATNHVSGRRGENYSNPREAKLGIDNFTIYSATGRDPAFEWKLHGWKAPARGYSFVLDAGPDTVPPEKVMTTGTRAVFRGVKPGKWYFHVRAVGEDGLWGPPSHRAVEILER